jgi:alkanesulfonate monooxygenase SsuD/methylene tetrahydromethanopterin reductase-like flavin-dependent oxidoreductase (luciferase family)
MPGPYWDVRTCSWQGSPVPGPPPIWVAAPSGDAAHRGDSPGDVVPAQPTAADADVVEAVVAITRSRAAGQLP